jgi:predicted amidophosphoribosyltransferase
VRKHLDQARPYNTVKKVQATDVVRTLQEAGHPTAIVTSLPLWYAKLLLERFGLKPDALVTAGDSGARKPEALLSEALDVLSVDPANAVFVGNEDADSVASARLGVLSVGAGWVDPDWYSYCYNAPDVWFRYPHQLLRGADTPALRQHGYVAEVVANGVSPEMHLGSALTCRNVYGEMYALGRYFPTGDVRQHLNSQLSMNIIKFKERQDGARAFAEALGFFLARLRVKDYAIVSVPAKPGQTDRLSQVLTKTTLPKGMTLIPNALCCVKVVKNYKGLNAGDRQKAIEGSMKASPLVAGHKMFVVDDVITSGATGNECIRALQQAGATEVYVVAFGQDQGIVEREKCPRCDDGFLKVRTEKRSGRQFMGCSNYSTCRHIEEIRHP